MIPDQHLPHELARPALAAVSDQLLEQGTAQAKALPVGADDDGELGFPVVRIRDRAHDAERLACLSRGVGDEGHLPLVVDLREASELRAGQLAHHAEEAEVDVVRIEVLEEAAVGRLVLGADGTDDDDAP